MHIGSTADLLVMGRNKYWFSMLARNNTHVVHIFRNSWIRWECTGFEENQANGVNLSQGDSLQQLLVGEEDRYYIEKIIQERITSNTI